MDRLFDPSFDPYEWLWEALQPLTGPMSLATLVDDLPAPMRVALADPQTRTTLGLFLLLLLGLALMRAGSSRSRASTSRQSDDKNEKFEGGTRIGISRLNSVWWRVRPVDRRYRWDIYSARTLAGRRLPPYRISTKRKHVGVVGATGSRKSTIVAKLVNGSRPTLILTGEPSDPLRMATFELMKHGKGIYWSPRYNCGWDMLQGDPLEIRERLTAGTSKSPADTGLGRGYVQDVVSAVLIACDRDSVLRNWDDILAVLNAYTLDKDERVTLERDRPYLIGPLAEADRLLKKATDCKMAFGRWSQRFEHMRSALGESIGHDLDLAEELAAGKTVFMEMSSMRSPESTPLVAANILLDGKRAAQIVKGGRLIVDEGWAFAERKAELNEVVRAGRRLGWEVYFLTQIPQDYSIDMIGNFRTWLFLLQTGTNTAALEWCSKAVGRKLPPEAFAEGYLEEGYGWLLTAGHITPIFIDWIDVSGVPDMPPLLARWAVQEVVPQGRVPLPPAGTGGERDDFDGTGSWDWPDGTGELELDGYVRGAVALPAATRPSPPAYFVRHPQLLTLWPVLTGTWDVNACWLIPKAKTNADNRAKVWMPVGTRREDGSVRDKGEYATGYVETCRALRGERPKPVLGNDGKLKNFEVDHSCHNEDLHCPGGKSCEHRRCMNGEHQQWVSPQVNSVRMQIRKRRRQELLRGERTQWRLTVAEEADRWIRDHAPAAVGTAL